MVTRNRSYKSFSNAHFSDELRISVIHHIYKCSEEYNSSSSFQPWWKVISKIRRYLSLSKTAAATSNGMCKHEKNRTRRHIIGIKPLNSMEKEAVVEELLTIWKSISAMIKVNNILHKMCVRLYINRFKDIMKQISKNQTRLFGIF